MGVDSKILKLRSPKLQIQGKQNLILWAECGKIHDPEVWLGGWLVLVRFYSPLLPFYRMILFSGPIVEIYIGLATLFTSNKTSNDDITNHKRWN
jgi:hypothetical protein